MGEWVATSQDRRCVAVTWMCANDHECLPPRGYIYTYTLVERGGSGLEIATPYFQIDVKMEGVCTIAKSYLAGPAKKIRIGDRMCARFRTGSAATHTALDLYFVLE